MGEGSTGGGTCALLFVQASYSWLSAKLTKLHISCESAVRSFRITFTGISMYVPFSAQTMSAVLLRLDTSVAPTRQTGSHAW